MRGRADIQTQAQAGRVESIPHRVAEEGLSELQVQLPENSRLIFYSDGITEAANSADEEYGRERLKQHLLQPEACAETILRDVHSFANGTGLQDDATVLMVRA